MASTCRPRSAGRRTYFFRRTASLTRWRRPAPTKTSCGAASAWVANEMGARSHELVYQSRSGPPQVPWLEPDVTDHLSVVKERGANAVVVVPIGFLSDHIEVLWDLDEEAAGRARELGLAFARAKSVGTDPLFVDAVAQLIEERVKPDAGAREAIPRVADGARPMPARLLRVSAASARASASRLLTSALVACGAGCAVSPPHV